ncbi:MAG: hypothetical protein CSA62_13740 [Planctomycetota bacterium]|nr:MAG: hypothetical protein CSA62_13740 [Planctomycetota bacterium]
MTPHRLGHLHGLLLTLPLLLCSCSSGPEDGLTLGTYVQNAQIYFRGGDDARALDQIERGLELRPEHYELGLLKGQIFVRQARQNSAVYDRALEQMRKVYGLRSLSDHDYRCLLFLGQAHLGLAIRNRRNSSKAREAAGASNIEPSERTHLLGMAAEHERLYKRHIADAERQFEAMLKKGDGVNPALRFLFIVSTYKSEGLEAAAQLRQKQKAIEVGEKYIADARSRLAHYSDLRARTLNLQEEAEADKRRSFYKNQVIDCLGQLAHLHYGLGQYQKALTLNDELVKLQPNFAAHYYNRGKCSYRLENWGLAIRDFQDFLRMTGEEQGKRREEVEKLLDKALAARRAQQRRR